MFIPNHGLRLKRSWIFFLCLIVILGLALRLASVYLGYSTVQDPERYEGQSGYAIWARNLLHGYGYGYGLNQPTAAMPPLPAILLAAVYYLFGEHNYIAVWLYKALLGTITIVLTYLVGKKAFNEKVGLGAASIVAFYPELIIVDTHLQVHLNETPLVFFFILTLYFFGRFVRTTSVFDLIWAGLSLGIAMLTHPSIWAFPIFAIIFLLIVYLRKQAMMFTAIVTGVTLLTVSPWLIRNYLIYGHLISSTSAAYVLFMGNNPQTQPHAYDTEKITGPSSPLKIWASMGGANPKLIHGNYGWGEDEYKRYEAANKYALNFIISQPVLFVQRGFGKVLDFWGSERLFVAWYKDGYYSQNFPRGFFVILALAIMVSYSLVLLLGLEGIIFAQKSPYQYLILLPILSLSLSSFIGQGHPKYHLTVVPVLAVFASWSVVNRSFIMQSIKSSKRYFLLSLTPIFCLLFIWGREVILGDFNKFFILLK